MGAYKFLEELWRKKQSDGALKPIFFGPCTPFHGVCGGPASLLRKALLAPWAPSLRPHAPAL
jgi:hypothetical protein